MNERIQKLKDQCWVEKRWTVVQDNGTWIEKHIDLEKFAELIVKECAEIAYNKQYKHSAAHTRGDCAEAIKQHFGVKE